MGCKRQRRNEAAEEMSRDGGGMGPEEGVELERNRTVLNPSLCYLIIYYFTLL